MYIYYNSIYLWESEQFVIYLQLHHINTLIWCHNKYHFKKSVCNLLRHAWLILLATLVLIEFTLLDSITFYIAHKKKHGENLKKYLKNTKNIASSININLNQSKLPVLNLTSFEDFPHRKSTQIHSSNVIKYLNLWSVQCC